MPIILSYNVRWNSDKIQIKNILNNIDNVLNTYDIDFMLFQEAYFYKKILKLIDLKKYNYHYHKSDKDILITIYKNNYTIKNVYDGEFEKGRPFSIFYFQNKITNNYFLFINLHAGHHPNINYHIFKPINEITKNLNITPTQIIMGGDFNKNIKTKHEINTKNKTFKLKFLNNNEKTCCDINSKRLYFTIDHIISSKKPIKKIVYKGKSPASDHLLILVEVNEI